MIILEFESDLLVDGEDFGSACVIWDGCIHRKVAEHFQRASNVEALIDDLKWRTETEKERDQVEQR